MDGWGGHIVTTDAATSRWRWRMEMEMVMSVVMLILIDRDGECVASNIVTVLKPYETAVVY